ncbi:MAG: hypothetical protein R3C68_02250 [Myxococcota bacterium]
MSIQDDVEIMTQIPDEDLWDIYQSIRDGAKAPAESFGFDTEALNAIENMALGCYRAKLYAKAAPIYGFILQMDVRHASAWRGLGACAHAIKNHSMAIPCYREAVKLDPEDTISQVFLGECLCQLGQQTEGLSILRQVVDNGVMHPGDAPYISRARAILGADGGIPSPIILQQHGKALAEEAAQQIDEATPSQDEDGQDLPLQWEHMQRNKELLGVLGELSKAVEEGRLTLAEVGGFTANELDGAYACACKYVEIGQVFHAMQIAGYLIFLDPHSGRYYQLIGICLQRLNQYDTAEHYYRLAQVFDKDDPMTLVYRGECRIMTGHTDEGLELIRQGQQLAKKKPSQNKELMERSEVLLRQFGG